MDSVESSSGDKIASRPSLTLKLGTELKSPSSSKNIKIIDQFEIKDNLTEEAHTGGYKPRGSIELRINEIPYVRRGSQEDVSVVHKSVTPSM